MCVCVCKMLAAGRKEQGKTLTVLHCHSDVERAERVGMKGWEGKDKSEKRVTVKIDDRGKRRGERGCHISFHFNILIIFLIPLQIYIYETVCESVTMQNLWVK